MFDLEKKTVFFLLFVRGHRLDRKETSVSVRQKQSPMVSISALLPRTTVSFANFTSHDKLEYDLLREDFAQVVVH